MAKNQAPHHAPDEPKSRALTLTAQGYSTLHIGELIGVPERTVYGWIARAREVAVNEESGEILKDWARITRRAQGKLHDYLDYLDDNPDEIRKHPGYLNAIAGTGTDKLQKERTPGGDTYVLALINQHAERMKPVMELEHDETDR